MTPETTRDTSQDTLQVTLQNTGPDSRSRARQSFTGKSLTDSQFDEVWNLSAIIAREIRKSGSFVEKLTDYAHAFARGERFDQQRGEIIIRDIFKARHAQSMNKMREDLMARQKDIETGAQDRALHHAQRVQQFIQTGDTMPFYRAYDQAATDMAREHGITEAGAKDMMKKAFEKAEGRSLYEAGKEVEQAYHKPAREAQLAERKQASLSRRQSGPAR